MVVTQPQLDLDRLEDLVRILPGLSASANIFRDVFSDYPPEMLGQLSHADLEAALEEIAGIPNVNLFQSTLTFQLSCGTQNLANLAFILLDKHLQVPRTTGNKPNVYTKQYNEVKAICDQCRDETATGLFSRKIPLDEIVFVPEQTVYAQNIDTMFPDGMLNCYKCGNRSFIQEQSGFAVVFRDKIEKGKKEEELRRRVEDIIGQVAERIQSINPRRSKVREDIVDSFYWIYKTLRENGEIQYPILYKLFEWVRRENLQLEQLRRMDNLTRDILKEVIYKNVLLPYAVIKARVKSLESIFRKTIRGAYDLKDDPNEKISLRDCLGLRIILPTIEDCNKLAASIKNDPQFEIIDYDNHIKVPKANGYRSIHIHLRHSGMMYSIHIRTHDMDRAAETDPRQKHDDTYVPMINRLIKDNVPPQMIRTFATLMGVYKSPLLLD